jgi:hypothetical protein
MKTLVTTPAIAATLIVALALATPSGASERAPGCPDDIVIGDPNSSDPWVLVGVGDPNLRRADRNGDEVACSATLRLFGRPVGRVLTDNAIGDPMIFPPDPFAPSRSATRTTFRGSGSST